MTSTASAVALEVGHALAQLSQELLGLGAGAQGRGASSSPLNLEQGRRLAPLGGFNHAALELASLSGWATQRLWSDDTQWEIAARRCSHAVAAPSVLLPASRPGPRRSALPPHQRVAKRSNNAARTLRPTETPRSEQPRGREYPGTRRQRAGRVGPLLRQGRRDHGVVRPSPRLPGA